MFHDRTMGWRGRSGAAAWAVAIALTVFAVGGVSVRAGAGEGGSVIAASGCGTFAPDVLYGAVDRPRSGPPAKVKKIVVMSPDEDELKRNFNKEQGQVRLVLILSPT